MSTPEMDDMFGRTVALSLRELPDVPGALERAAIALFPTAPRAASAPAPSVWRQVAAALSFDSWTGPGLAHGMRSTQSATRHLLFAAEGRDIDLRITSPRQKTYELTGQVLGPDEAGEAELQRVGADTSALRRSTLDSLAEFRIADLEPGQYQLTLQMGDQRIVFPPLELGKPTS